MSQHISGNSNSSTATTILQRPAVTSHIFKFATNAVKRAVELAHVSCDFRDAVVNYSPGMWANVIAHDQPGVSRCIRNTAVITFPVVAVVKQGTESDLVEVLKRARSFSNHRLIHELLRVFADRVNRLPLPQLLAAVSTADLCAWLFHEPQAVAEDVDARWIASALFRQPQEQQPHTLLELARRVAALPSPPSGLASSGWSFFIAVFLFAAAASSTNEAATWLQQFPHRFTVTHPEAREWFGQLVRARIGQQQQQSDSFWFSELAPALLRIVHETRNNKGKQDLQQVITAASNAASLLFAVRVSNYAVDLSGCVLEDCNLVAADLANVVFKSTQLRECVVEGWIGGSNISNETTQLLERGKRRELLNTLSGHPSTVNSVAFSPNGKSIVSGGDDKTMKVWDAETGNCIHTLSGHSHYVTSVAFSPDGNNILSGSWDKTMKVWDASTGTCVRTLSGHTSLMYGVAFSPDGNNILSGSRDKTVKVWDAATGSCIRTLSGHTSLMYGVAFSPDGKSVVSGSDDKTIKVWNTVASDSIRSAIDSSIQTPPDAQGQPASKSTDGCADFVRVPLNDAVVCNVVLRML